MENDEIELLALLMQKRLHSKAAKAVSINCEPIK